MRYFKRTAAVLLLAAGLAPALIRADSQDKGPTPNPAPTYDPAGRRDPFKNLFGGQAVKENRLITGLADLMIDEIQIIGIVKSKGIYKAILGMTNGFPLTVREGDAFADGYILSIRDREIVLRKTKELGLPLSKPKDVVRDITTEER